MISVGSEDCRFGGKFPPLEKEASKQMHCEEGVQTE